MSSRSFLKKLVPLTLAGMINAFGITIFLAPVHLYDSGISGTAMLLGQLTPSYLSLSFFLLVLNMPLFLYGLREQGLRFTLSSIYCVAIYSLTAWLINDVLPIDVSIASPLAGSDLLLCALFGGLISGVGSGTAIRYGGAMDGIEVMAVIFARRLGLSVGTFIMLYNVALYVICGIVLHTWVLPLYSIVTYGAGLKTVDFIVEGLDRSKAAVIITTRPDEVCDALLSAFHQGMTRIAAQGAYSGAQVTLIYFVVNRFQITRLRDLVHEVDQNAYIAINEIADVFHASQTDPACAAGNTEHKPLPNQASVTVESEPTDQAGQEEGKVL